MQLFENIKTEKAITPVAQSGRHFTKTNLIKHMERSDHIIELTRQWLLSFDKEMSKETFIANIRRLHQDDTKAEEQLRKATGNRSIQKVVEIIPIEPLVIPIIKLVADGATRVAVDGNAAIKQYITDCKGFGSVYIIDVDVLMGEFQSYKDKGSAEKILRDAVASDFVCILGLNIYKQMGYAPTEHLRQIIKLREEKGKPTITDYTTRNQSNRFWKYYYEGFTFYRI